MHSMWTFVLLAATVALCSAYEYEDGSEPEEGFTKRATANMDRLAAIPRSGLMISGRGWMPGFVDQPRSIFKRSVPLHKILVRPMNVPVA